VLHHFHEPKLFKANLKSKSFNKRNQMQGMGVDKNKKYESEYQRSYYYIPIK